MCLNCPDTTRVVIDGKTNYRKKNGPDGIGYHGAIGCYEITEKKH